MALNDNARKAMGARDAANLLRRERQFRNKAGKYNNRLLSEANDEMHFHGADALDRYTETEAGWSLEAKVDKNRANAEKMRKRRTGK